MSKNSIYSMTGFGAGSVDSDDLSVRVEVRSVNHRGKKVGVRSRPSLGAFEKNLRDILDSRLLRGSIDVTVNLTRRLSLEHEPQLLDTAAASVSAVRQLAEKLGLSHDLSARDLLTIPGLFDSGSNEPVGEDDWPAIETALVQALDQLCAMRLEEGEATGRRLLEIVQPVEDFRVNVRVKAPQVVERQRTKLRERLAELDNIRSSDEQALERELLFYADRCDVNEEMDRLESHVAQFRSVIETGGEVGKRLEFLAQEMLREVNTTASKANDVEITGWSVDAKMAVEKIKEQSANME